MKISFFVSVKAASNEKLYCLWILQTKECLSIYIKSCSILQLHPIFQLLNAMFCCEILGAKQRLLLWRHLMKVWAVVCSLKVSQLYLHHVLSVGSICRPILQMITSEPLRYLARIEWEWATPALNTFAPIWMKNVVGGNEWLSQGAVGRGIINSGIHINVKVTIIGPVI